ncbi:hypothetical protein R3P38DRAFT_3353204 [Favolaschia claudopus]|uniref:Uncharacterized protein n=1 Tax=Favolaschia claudopus TaxID=2862362 RepID=A0AAW0BUQ3_9AGAR
MRSRRAEDPSKRRNYMVWVLPECRTSQRLWENLKVRKVASRKKGLFTLYALQCRISAIRLEGIGEQKWEGEIANTPSTCRVKVAPTRMRGWGVQCRIESMLRFSKPSIIGVNSECVRSAKWFWVGLQKWVSEDCGAKTAATYGSFLPFILQQFFGGDVKVERIGDESVLNRSKLAGTRAVVSVESGGRQYIERDVVRPTAAVIDATRQNEAARTYQAERRRTHLSELTASRQMIVARRHWRTPWAARRGNAQGGQRGEEGGGRRQEERRCHNSDNIDDELTFTSRSQQCRQSCARARRCPEKTLRFFYKVQSR